MLHERSQPQRTQILRIHLYKMPRIGKSIETKSRLLVARDTEGGKRGVITNEYRASFWSDENNLELDIGDACTILWIY